MLFWRKISVIFTVMTVFALGSCESAEEKIAKKIASVQNAENVSLTPDGMAIFRKNCVTCHGSNGKLGLNGAKDLSISTLSMEERVGIITNGKNLMTPFAAVLSPKEIQAVAAFTLTLKEPSSNAESR